MLCKNLVLGLIAVAPVLVEAMLPIHIKNYRFIQPSSPDNDPKKNKVFYVKGIDYQPGGSSGYDSANEHDILSDPDICARDAYAFQQLGINTIRIYSVNPDLNHDKCMTILNDAGIYVILDVNSGNYGENLNRADPKGSYGALYLSRVFKMIDAFKNYPNLLGFFSGNEVINDQADYAEFVPPYMRAVQRDMRQYIAKHSNRTIPVGYSAADNTDLRLATFKYLQCNSLDGKKIDKALNESRSDFFGLNSYEWCSGTSDWKSSGFDKLNSTFSDAVIPLIFSEYGCNKNLPRTFDEVTDAIYTDKGLGKVFSGGLVYEYAEEANKYGLVNLDEDDKSLSYKKDFVNLKDRFSKVKTNTTFENKLSNNTIYKCDKNAILKIYKKFGVANFTIPKQPKEITDMIKKGVKGDNIGKLLPPKNYTVPTSVKYTIKDQNGKTLKATIKYEKNNTINELTKHNATKKAVENKESNVTSIASSASVSKTTETSISSSSTSSKSKGDAAMVELSTSFIQSGIFAVIISALL
ncbi:probable 1,3-beta-glucanosyltransferase Gas3p [Monosporozyma servazzii]